MGFWDFDFWGKEVILSCANELTQWNRVMDFRRFHCSCKSADWWNSTVFSMSITRCGMTYAGWPCALSLASLRWSIAAWQVVQPMLESYVCQLYCVRSPHSVLHCTGHLVVSLFHTSTMWHDDFSIGGGGFPHSGTGGRATWASSWALFWWSCIFRSGELLWSSLGIYRTLQALLLVFYSIYPWNTVLLWLWSVWSGMACWLLFMSASLCEDTCNVKVLGCHRKTLKLESLSLWPRYTPGVRITFVDENIPRWWGQGNEYRSLPDIVLSVFNQAVISVVWLFRVHPNSLQRIWIKQVDIKIRERVIFASRLKFEALI